MQNHHQHETLTNTPAWCALKTHTKEFDSFNLKQLFAANSNRFTDFSLKHNDILFDYSKNLVTEQTMQYLFELARQEQLQAKIQEMFTGEIINFTEKRAVLHVALRNRSNTPIYVQGEDVTPKVDAVLDKMETFIKSVHNGTFCGFTGEKFTDIVNIGIGGSDLGPKMVVEALRPYQIRGLNTHFVSNVDSSHLIEVLKRVHPETTLFVVSSKTFTTQETMTNANTARQWFLDRLDDKSAIASHFVAVSTNIPKVKAFGIDEANIFEFWDWVGGRFSLWSAIGLSIGLAVGMKNFYELLEGAHEMDNHFSSTPLEKNLPVVMALLGIWYSSFVGAQSYAILPYDQYMHRFSAYLQQAEMESNGKRVDRDGNVVDYKTSPIIWGEPGTNGQHAFYQLVHQGTTLIPVDFLAPIDSHNPSGEHHKILLANFFAQSEALMHGRDLEASKQQLIKQGIAEEEATKLAPHLEMPGNKPSSSILFKTLNPKTLGALIALYEHKIFAQGVIWRINSFDQWGVELGKILASAILPQLDDDQPISDHDGSTNGLVNYYKSERSS